MVCSIFNCYVENTNCSDLFDQLPNLEFAFEAGAKVFQVPPKEYLLQQDTICFIAAQGQLFTDMYILGDVFLRNFYAIYNLDNSSVGLSNTYQTDLITDPPSLPTECSSNSDCLANQTCAAITCLGVPTKLYCADIVDQCLNSTTMIVGADNCQISCPNYNECQTDNDCGNDYYCAGLKCSTTTFGVCASSSECSDILILNSD